MQSALLASHFFSSPGVASQTRFPAQGGESSQTGHMDNHLKLITHLCQRDGPQTSGSDDPPLLPAAQPETFYQMLQGNIQHVQHPRSPGPTAQADPWELICTRQGSSDFSVVIVRDSRTKHTHFLPLRHPKRGTSP